MDASRLTILALAGSLIASGCISSAGTDPEEASTLDAASTVNFPVSAEDPAGDAFEMSASSVVADSVCWRTPAYDPCYDTLTGADPTREPAPHFDLLGLTVEGETVDHLLVSLELAQVSADLAEFAAADGMARTVWFGFCFSQGEDWAWRCPFGEATHWEGDSWISGSLGLFDEDCNEWAWCTWDVPVEVVPGEPGALRFALPKAALLHDGAPPEIREVAGWIGWSSPNPVSPYWHGAYTVYAADRHFHAHPLGGGGGYGQTADWTDDVELRADFTPSGTIDEARSGDVVLQAATGIAEGDIWSNPAYDVRSVRFEESDTDLLVHYEMGAYDEDAVEGMHIMHLFGVEGKEVWEMGFLREGGDSYGYVGRCISFPCAGVDGSHDEQEGLGPSMERLPFEVNGNDPAIITVPVPMELLSTVEPGDRVNMQTVAVMYSEAGVYFGDYGDDVHGDVHKMGFLDAASGGIPYVFG